MNIAEVGELISEFAPLTLIVDYKGVVLWFSEAIRNEFSIVNANISTFEELFNTTIENVIGDSINIIDIFNNKYYVKVRDFFIYNEKYFIVYLTSTSDDDILFSLKMILESIDEGIIMCDSNSNIQIYNNAMEELEGKKKSDMVGKSVYDVFTYNDKNQSIHKKVMTTGEPVTNRYGTYICDKGRSKYVSFSTYPIIKNGKIIGTYSINRNETKLHSLLSETIELKRRFASDSSLEIDNDNNKCSSNGTRYTFSDIIGCSKVMTDLIKKAQTMSWLDNNILIVGDTGTGKEVFAQSIHNYGKRCKEPFIGINCSAIPENLLESTLFGTVKGAFTGALDQTGLFEEAKEGTLFLDELCSMPITMQAKLLRVIQERTIIRVGGTKFIPIKCRIISAMNEDPQQLIETGKLRKDLFYRIAGLYLYIPPLRERIEDTFEMTNYFISKHNRKINRNILTIDNKLRKIMEIYEWPGNVRELEYFVENMMIKTKEDDKYLSIKHMQENLKISIMNSVDLYSPVRNRQSLANKLDDFERSIISKELDNNNWNISKTSKELGIGRQGLYYKMKRLGIEKCPSV